MDYLIHYKKNVDNLRNEVDELRDARNSLQQKVNATQRNVEESEDKVLGWLKSVEEITEKAKEFFEKEGQAKLKCCNGFCFNLKTCYQLGRRAHKLELAVKDIKDKGTFKTVGPRVPIQGGTKIFTRGYENFESRKLIFDGVMKDLKDDNISVIGVCGMGGTGKTMLVRNVANQAIEDKLFERIVIVFVSQTPNLKQVQENIARELDLRFQDEDTDFQKAHLLCERLKKEKILLIIDDIWDKIDLEALGIPYHKGIKLLLTSRFQDVLSMDMGAQKIFHVSVLSNNEAEKLFSKIVGDSFAENLNFRSTIVEVVRECAGLPIAITTIANALKNQGDLNVWKDALQQLKWESPTQIRGMHDKVYQSICFSYNSLTNEAQRLFLLCTIFEEDKVIPIDLLWRILVGLDFFEDVYTVEELRNVVYRLVESLKDSCLLLEGDRSGTFKMHDVIRDVGIYIADRDRKMLTIRSSEEWSNMNKLNDSIGIALFDVKFSDLPERLECPQLQFILLGDKENSAPIPNHFFEGAKKLKVLVLMRVSHPLPSSLSLLHNLQMLALLEYNSEDVALIGELKNLKALILSGSNIKLLPIEIGQLTHLQLLDLERCTKLEVIPSNVLSNLKKLEELYMKSSFNQWQVDGESAERNNARVSELDHLSFLTTLCIHIPNAKILPKALLFEKLRRYEILIGNDWDWDCDNDSDIEFEISRTLKLELYKRFQVKDEIKILLKSCEYLDLIPREGIKNILDEVDKEGFPLLKHLSVRNSTEIQYIINLMGIQCVAFPLLEILSLENLINLKKICHYHDQLAMGSFHSLRKLEVSNCNELIFVFSLTIPGCFGQLQELVIKNCKVMHAIVAMERKHEIQVNEITEDNIVGFTQLRSLDLQNLPNLMGFYSDVDSQLLFNEKVAFSNLEKILICGINNLKTLWHNQIIPSSFCKLSELCVDRCENLMNIFPLNMLRRLQNLKVLQIRNCNSVEEVFGVGGVNDDEIRDMVSTQLRVLRLINLPKLKHVWTSDLQAIITFQNLCVVEVSKCKSLKSLFPVSVAQNFEQLETLYIYDSGLEEIVAMDEGLETTTKFVFPRVTSLNLESLPELNCFYPGKHTSEWPSLKWLTIHKCGKMKTVASNLLSFPDTNVLGHHVSVQLPFAMTEKFEFPDLEMIWEKELHQNSVFKLKKLIVEWHHSLINFFLPDMLRGIQYLEELQIINCDSTEEVFVSPGANVEEISFQLRYLSLDNLPKLQRVWGLDPGGICTFQNIHEFKVSNCGSLRSLFPVSVAKQLLQLGLLEICDCGLEEIVGKEERLKTTFIFPQLTSLILKRLPQLKSFYGGEYKSQWPLLKDLNICYCDKLKSLGSDALSYNETLGLSNRKKNHLPPVFLIEKDTFPNLERLKLDWKDISNWEQIRFPAQFFSKLKVLELNGALFEELCGLASEEEQYAWTLERLTVLKLSKMTNLKHMWKGDTQSSMALQNLQKLVVSDCEILVNLVPPSMSFQNLRKMVVSKCHDLKYLVDPSTARSLVRLTKMVIFDCKKMEKIVANEGNEERDEIIFRDLKYLDLQHLQSLTSFHSGNCIIKFPSLKGLIKIECPKFETSFNKLPSMTRRKELKQAEKDEPVLGNHSSQTEKKWEGDLISTIKRFWEDNFEKVPLMEDNDFDDVEDIARQDSTSFPEDISDQILPSVNEMSAACRTPPEETVFLASLPQVVAGSVAEKTSVEDIISSCLDAELPKIVGEGYIHEDGPVMKENANVCLATNQPVVTSDIQQGASTSLLSPAAPSVSQESLDSFLARFDEDGTNEHTASHFWTFSGKNADWLQFSVPADSIPLLERLLAKHGDFVARLKLGAGIGNFLLRLLAAILMDMHNTHLDSLSERKLFEWKNAMKDLIQSGLAVEFLLRYLRYIGNIWFNRKSKAQLASYDERIAKQGANLSELKSETEQLWAIVPEMMMHNELVTHYLF